MKGVPFSAKPVTPDTAGESGDQPAVSMVLGQELGKQRWFVGGTMTHPVSGEAPWCAVIKMGSPVG